MDTYNHEDYEERTLFPEDYRFIRFYVCKGCGAMVSRIDLHNKFHALFSETEHLTRLNRLIG